jgi:hypothetical protein
MTTRKQDYDFAYREGFSAAALEMEDPANSTVSRDDAWRSFRRSLPCEDRDCPRLKLAFSDGWQDAEDRENGEVFAGGLDRVQDFAS